MEVRNNPIKDENDINIIYAPVAQLDRVLVSETKGHRFESCRARQLLKPHIILGGFSNPSIRMLDLNL